MGLNRPVTPEQLVDSARAEWERGRARQAVRQAWEGVNHAMDFGSRDVLEQAADLADTIAAEAQGRPAKDAAQLATYCRHCLAGVGNGAKANSVVSVIFGWRRKQTCPDCAEQISKDARACPHCGFRILPPPEG